MTDFPMPEPEVVLPDLDSDPDAWNAAFYLPMPWWYRFDLGDVWGGDATRHAIDVQLGPFYRMYAEQL